MNHLLRRRCVVLAAIGSAMLGNAIAAEPGAVREIAWDELVPKDWDPMKEIGATDPGQLKDGDPRAAALMKKMQAAFDNAPANPAMDGAQVKIPGYIVPLEQKKAGEITEFLLVPYFGACIHTPPPPANQIIHVKTSNATKGLRAMDTIWVTGRMQTQRNDSMMGASGYHVTADSVTKYTGPVK